MCGSEVKGIAYFQYTDVPKLLCNGSNFIRLLIKILVMRFIVNIISVLLKLTLTCIVLVSIFLTLAFLEINLRFGGIDKMITSLVSVFNLSVITIGICCIVWTTNSSKYKTKNMVD